MPKKGARSLRAGRINSGQLISYGNNKNNTNIGAEGAPTGLFSQM